MILTFAILDSDSDSDSDSGIMDHTRTTPFSNTLELPLSGTAPYLTDTVELLL